MGNLFLSFDKPSLIADLLFLGCSIGILGSGIYLGLRRYKLSPGYWAILLISIGYYCSFRFFPAWRPTYKFDFIPLTFTKVPYLDIFFGTLLISLVLYSLLNKYFECKKKILQKKYEQNPRPRFLYDNPIENDEDDWLGYGELADQIIKLILDPRPTKHAFTLGINGQWGIGKTSLLNLLRSHLLQKQDKGESDHILISFSPLILNDSNNLTIEFFNQLHYSLKTYSYKSSEQIRKYIYFLTNKINDFWSVIFSILFGDRSSQEQSEIISRLIRKINRQVIVVIDDLDRIEKEEITEIFRLVRNIGNLSNILYVIAYDKTYLCKKLDDRTFNNAESFIEKFFSAEIVLPNLKFEQLREDIVKESRLRIPHFASEIESTFSYFESHRKLQENMLRKVIPTDFLEQALSTRRDLKRFINSLILIPNENINEIVFSELIIIEILRLKYFEIYSSLKEKSILGDSQSKEYYTLDDSKLEEILKENYPTRENTIKTAVNVLFGTGLITQESPNRLSFVNRDRYEIYFNYLDTTFFCYSEVDSLRAEKKGIKEFIQESIEKHESIRRQTIKYLKHIDDFYSFEDFKDIIATMIELDQFQRSNNDRIIELIRGVWIGNQFQEKKIKEFVLKYLKDEIPYGKKYSLYYTLFKDFQPSGYFDFPISEEEFKDICFARLKEYTENPEITIKKIETCFELYYLCIDYIKSDSKIILQERAHKQMRRFVDKYPYEYIEFLIRPYTTPLQKSEPTFTTEPFMEKTFNGWENFWKFLDEFKHTITDESILHKLQMYYAFFERFRDNGYRPVLIPFEDWGKYGIDDLVKGREWTFVG